MHREEFEIELESHGGMADITSKVEEIINRSGKGNGLAVVFVQGSTASVTTIEYEPGLKKDLPAIMEKLAPYGADYKHHDTWHDDNGASHIRASTIGPSLAVPFSNGKLLVGTWQQIVVINWDTRMRRRRVIVTVI